MADEQRPDLTKRNHFYSWALYGLSATISVVSATAYFDMRKQRDNCQEEVNYYSRESFKKAMEIKKQEEVIEIQEEAIVNSTNYINDSVQVVKVQPLKSNKK